MKRRGTCFCLNQKQPIIIKEEIIMKFVGAMTIASKLAVAETHGRFNSINNKRKINTQEIIIKKYFLFRKMNTLYQEIIISVCFL